MSASPTILSRLVQAMYTGDGTSCEKLRRFIAQIRVWSKKPLGQTGDDDTDEYTRTLQAREFSGASQQQCENPFVFLVQFCWPRLEQLFTLINTYDCDVCQKCGKVNRGNHFHTHTLRLLFPDKIHSTKRYPVKDLLPCNVSSKICCGQNMDTQTLMENMPEIFSVIVQRIKVTNQVFKPKQASSSGDGEPTKDNTRKSEESKDTTDSQSNRKKGQKSKETKGTTDTKFATKKIRGRVVIPKGRFEWPQPILSDIENTPTCEVYGVVVHIGEGTDSGHWVTYIKEENTPSKMRCWTEYNDSLKKINLTDEDIKVGRLLMRRKLPTAN